jgi:hypothetical protein
MLNNTGLARVLVGSGVDDLSKHVGVTDVAAPRACWRHFENKNRFAVLRGKRAKTGLLYLKSFALDSYQTT